MPQQYEYTTPYMLVFEIYSSCDKTLELYRLTPGKIFGIKEPLNKSDMGEHRPLHQHNYYEIMLVLEGQISHHIEQKYYTYMPGQCCVIDKKISHAELFLYDFTALFIAVSDHYAQKIEAENCYPDSSGISIPYSDSILKFILSDIYDKHNLHKRFIDFTPIYPFELQKPAPAEIIYYIISESIFPQCGYHLIIKGLILRLFHIFDNSSFYNITSVKIDSNPQEFLYLKIMQLLETHNGKITRAELEEFLHYNGDYLNRITKQYCGSTLTQCAQTIRLKRAGKLLLESNLSINDIIDHLGYSNKTYFYKLFASQYGMTPNEYRQNTR